MICNRGPLILPSAIGRSRSSTHHPAIISANRQSVSEFTFRKTALLLFAAGGAGLTIVILLVLDFKPVRGTFGGAVVFAAFLYLFWLLGWHSKVRMDSAGVVEWQGTWLDPCPC